jgi:beta-lactamase regulating signal transducer with metallopeptidase domain
MATLHALDGVIDWLLRTSFAAAILAMLILGINAILRRSLPASARYALLLLVAGRLVMPFAPQSRFSVFNLFANSHTASRTTAIANAQPTGQWVITKQPLPGVFLPSSSSLATEASAGTPLTWKTAAAGIWIAGILLMSIRITAANLKLSRRLRSAKLLGDASILHLLQSCKSQMKIHRALTILQTDAIESPALMGSFRPRLLLPLDLLQRLSDDELRFVFLHELAHLKRHDIAIDWCLAILQILHWFNPVIAFAFARARAERELARDAMVLAAASPDEQTGYGQTIVKLVESFAGLGPRPGTIGILESNSGKAQLKRRIVMIADFKKPMPGAMILAALIAAVLAAALLTDRKVSAAPEATVPDKAKSEQSDPNRVPPAPAPRAEQADTAPIDRSKAQDAAVQAILDRKVPEVNFNATALGDVVDFLRDITGANISVNWKALAAAGIEKTAPVTTRMRDVKFSTALKAILKDAGGDNVKLGFEIDEGVLVITTAEELDKHTEVRVYDVRDLLMIKDDKVDAAQLKDLTEAIEQSIEPTSWVTSGGSIGTIKHLSGQIVVTQTKENQKQVESLLEKLRESRGVQISIRSHLIKVSPAVLKQNDILIEKVGPLIAKQPGKSLKPLQATFLDDDQLDKLFKSVQASPDSTILSAPRVMLFNGQQGSIAIGEEIPYITGWTAPKDGKRDPQVSFVKTGFIFNLQGTVSADRKYVTMNMQPRIAKLLKMDQAPWPQAPANEKLNVQNPDLAVQEVDEVVSIPNGGTLLTVLSEKEEKGNDGKGTINILLVSPSILIPHEAEQPRPPQLLKRPEQ